MKTRTKDRLMTGGAVLLICAVGVVLPGCAVNNSRLPAGGDQLISNPSRLQQSYWDSICTTDTDCEMHERLHTKHRDRETVPKWKLWTTIAVGMAITGYLYAQRQRNGSDQRSMSGIDVFTPGVNCDVAGRPGGGCAQ